MISLLPITLGILMNGISVAMQSSPESILAAVISMMCITAAMALRRYFLLVISIGISGFGYLSFMLSQNQSVQVGPAILFGAIAFLILETGHDVIVCVREGVKWRSFRYRMRHISVVILISAVLPIAYLTLSYNMLVFLPTFPAGRLMYAALFTLGIVLAVALAVFIIRKQGR